MIGLLNSRTENFGFGLVTAVQSDPVTPVKFNNAWNHKDQEQCKLWRDAIQKELNSMNKRNVWSIVPILEISDGRKPIGNKWVLKIKRDGRYCARLVCLGYTQVPGIDFQDNFAPVVNGFIKIILWIDFLVFSPHETCPCNVFQSEYLFCIQIEKFKSVSRMVDW